MNDMKVAETDYSKHWGDEDDPASDWSLLCEKAPFAHKEICEFILYVGAGQHLKDYYKWGFSPILLLHCKRAQRAGYKYLCFHN